MLVKEAGIIAGIDVCREIFKEVDPELDLTISFKDGDKEKITIRHLLTMGSGLKWDESYGNPLSTTSSLYYGHDLMGIVNALLGTCTYNDLVGRIIQGIISF